MAEKTVESALPKTSDGVTILPEMWLYRAVSPTMLYRRWVETVCADGFWAQHGTLKGSELTYFHAYRFYSTEAAAWENAES